jgi:hypothetical protein
MGSSCFLEYDDSIEGFQVLRQEEAWSDKLEPGGKMMPISQSGMIQSEDVASWFVKLLRLDETIKRPYSTRCPSAFQLHIADLEKSL